MFFTRIFWLELNVPRKIVSKKFAEYFGNEEREITNRNKAIKKLKNIVDFIQNKMVDRISNDNKYNTLKELCGIFNECHKFYILEKEIRQNLSNRNVYSEEITDVLEQNRNICRNIIDSANIWIENCVLLQKEGSSIDSELNINFDLMLDIYIYGIASQGLSLLNLSKKLAEGELYYGIKITPGEDIPIDILKDKPVIYFNPLIMGNQNNLAPIPLSRESNSTDFGTGFKKQFNIEFLSFLSVMQYFQKVILRDDESGMVIMDKELFIERVESIPNLPIKASDILNNFTLTKEMMKSQLRKKEPIIWVVGSNKVRYELCPFICLENNKIMVTYGGLEQAKQLWVSISSNGGSVYTNTSDSLTDAIGKRNKELSDILVEILRDKLRKHYNADFDEKEVKYNRIFGEREINYGDFDVMFYTKDTNELFLIEAKYFSDSLNSGSMVTDYKKLFEEDGYYDKCRRRYDLVLEEVDKLKDFIGVKGNVKGHLLFISSKPMEIDFQDNDGVVSFLCLNIFDKYIEEKLISEDGSKVVRPTHII